MKLEIHFQPVFEREFLLTDEVRIDLFYEERTGQNLSYEIRGSQAMLDAMEAAHLPQGLGVSPAFWQARAKHVADALRLNLTLNVVSDEKLANGKDATTRMDLTLLKRAALIARRA